jgi:hypothetical protein
VRRQDEKSKIFVKVKKKDSYFANFRHFENLRHFANLRDFREFAGFAGFSRICGIRGIFWHFRERQESEENGKTE